MATSYAVVLRTREIPKERIRDVARVVAAINGTQVLDETRALRLRLGLPLEGISKEVAARAAGDLQEIGIKAAAQSEDAVEALEQVRSVLRAECSSESLRIEPEEQHAWDRVAGVSMIRHHPQPVHRERPTPRRWFIVHAMPSMGFIPAYLPGGREFERSREEMLSAGRKIAGEETYVLDLFLAEPPSTLRFDARRFHYGYLGERMHERSDLNFHSLVADLVANAKRATLAPAVARFLEGDVLKDFVVADLREFDAHNCWFLLANAAFAEGSSAEG